MELSKISNFNAIQFVLVNLEGVLSNSMIHPKFLGWSIEKIKIDKFFEIFQFLYGKFCFHMILLGLCLILTKIAAFDSPCLK